MSLAINFESPEGDSCSALKTRSRAKTTGDGRYRPGSTTIFLATLLAADALQTLYTLGLALILAVASNAANMTAILFHEKALLESDK